MSESSDYTRINVGILKAHEKYLKDNSISPSKLLRKVVNAMMEEEEDE